MSQLIQYAPMILALVAGLLVYHIFGDKIRALIGKRDARDIARHCEFKRDMAEHSYVPVPQPAPVVSQEVASPFGPTVLDSLATIEQERKQAAVKAEHDKMVASILGAGQPAPAQPASIPPLPR